MATQVATKVVSSVHPGSAFPELLRRSRFASFDPTIRQSYGTPPSHLHRGNWGLKRPIAQRKRNAFISLINFEEHEHYIEWSNAESQVRLIDKIEELNVAPKLVPQVPWFVGLGPAASTPWSMMDSEFCPGESGKYMSNPDSAMPSPPKSLPAFTTDLPGLGLRGKGEYGMKQSPKPSKADDGYLHPNLHAMSPKVFNRYLKQLRSLRPQFQKFLKENGVSTSIRETGVPPGNLHIRFLGQHFDKQFHVQTPNQTQPIRQQPHRLGGLMYASPTYLESYFSANVQPGIVLETGSQQNYSSPEEADSFLISTAGFIGKLEKKKAGPEPVPAFNASSGGLAHPPAALLAGQTRGNTFINVRVVDLHLERLPAAVTAFPSENSSKEVNIRMELAIHPSPNDHSRTNTHTPGSMHYNAPEDSQQNKSMTALRRYSYLDHRQSSKMYEKNPANKLHGQKDTTAATGSFGKDALLSKLSALATNPNRRPEQAGSPFETLGMSWSRPPRKRNWQDDQWVEGPNPDKEDGSA